MDMEVSRWQLQCENLKGKATISMLWRKIISSLKIEDGYLIIIFALMTIAIIAKSYFDPHGFLTPDSCNYLGLTQNLFDGNGLFVSTSPYTDTSNDRELFARWPIGYPLLIYLTTKLTGFSVFWASKVLNILLIGVTLGVFRVLFKQSAYLYGVIFLFASYTQIYSNTWSETVFITALVLFATSISYFILSHKKNRTLYFLIMFSSLLLFFSRYIGAFSFGLIGLLGLYYFVKRDRTTAITLIGIAVVNSIVMALYLYHNQIETGFPTGASRSPSLETNWELLHQLSKALVAETLIPYLRINLIGGVVQFFVIGCFLWKSRKNLLQKNSNIKINEITYSSVFGVIGFTYLFCIILIRWLTQFDDYDYRLLAPGSFLLFIACIAFIEKYATQLFFNYFKIFLISFALISWFINVPYAIWEQKEKSTYSETVGAIKEKYVDVEESSVVIFGEKHLKYLRTDLRVRIPGIPSGQRTKETWDNFISRVNPEHKKNVYLNIPDRKLNNKKYDQTIVDMVETHRHNSKEIIAIN
jgi:hypothetical protein